MRFWCKNHLIKTWNLHSLFNYKLWGNSKQLMYELHFILYRFHLSVKLSFFHYMHSFNTTQYRSGCFIRLESLHRTHTFLNETAILFHYIIEIFNLPYLYAFRHLYYFQYNPCLKPLNRIGIQFPANHLLMLLWKIDIFSPL